MPSPSTPFSTASVQASGWSRRRAGTPMASWAWVVSRLPVRTRGPAGRAGAASKPGRAPLPVPNAAAASSTASSCSRSPAMATTVFAGRYVARQKSRMAAVGNARMPASSPQISRPSGPSPNIACWMRIWAYSDGSSKYDRISSTMTVRSCSMSASSSVGRTISSPSTVHRRARLAPRDADPVDGRLAVCGGVRTEPPTPSTASRDRARRRVARRALERQVLHEVGDARLLGRSPPATRPARRRRSTPIARPAAGRRSRAALRPARPLEHGSGW